MMKEPKDILKLFERYTPEIDDEIKGLLKSHTDLDMYKMISYFFGFLDKSFKEMKNYGGKRFRPGICLFLAECYGVKEKALELATAIEIFHNFTLIHDDIEDRDELRRGRPTLWKLWGINHGINTGDAQLHLVNEELYKYAEKNPQDNIKILLYINQKFLEVVEGQYLDFTLSELPINDKEVNMNNMIDMIGRKSAVLVGCSASTAGMVAGLDQSEIDNLWNYGYNLGLTYQFCDDLTSIWGNKEESGKDELADIREKKKTLPILYLYQNADKKTQARLVSLYSKRNDLTTSEIYEVKKMLDDMEIKNLVINRARKSLDLVYSAIEKLSISNKNKKTLREINDALFPVLGGE